MAVIGIIGGVACGKSFVASQLKALGAEIIDADALGHDVLRDPAIRAALVQRWGDGILDESGEVSRQAVAREVFGASSENRGNLEFLENLVHPEIGRRMQAQLATLSAARPGAVVVIDAALLIEAGWAEYCDKIIFVDVPRSARLARAERRGWTEVEFSAREAAQANLDTKRKRADWVMDNSGSAEHTFAQVQQFWRTLS